MKSYVLDYRTEGRRRRVTLARVAEASLRDARRLAGRELVAIRAGGRGPLERRREAREAPTVDDALRRYFEEFAPSRQRIGRLAPKTIEEYGYVARRHLSPALGSRRLADVNRKDVERLVDGLTGPQRNRVLAFTSRLFTLAERWDWREQRSNPVRGVERAREEPRDRVLRPSELAALSAALDQIVERFPVSVGAIKVAAITGLRIGEVIGIEWEHIDFESGRLTMPETKTGRRVHHLPVAAREMLRRMPRIDGIPFVFTTTGCAAVTLVGNHDRHPEAPLAKSFEQLLVTCEDCHPSLLLTVERARGREDDLPVAQADGMPFGEVRIRRPNAGPRRPVHGMRPSLERNAQPTEELYLLLRIPVPGELRMANDVVVEQ